MSRSSLLAIVLVAPVALATLVTLAATPPTRAQSITDDNPRNKRYDGVVIEHVSLRPGPDTVAVTIHLRNLGRTSVNTAVMWGDQVPVPPGAIGPGEREAVASSMRPGDVPYDEPIQLYELLESGMQGDLLDAAHAPRPGTRRVALLIEQRTLEAGDARFGSFVRRMRLSLEYLHAYFDQTAVSLTPDPRLRREAIRERFRIDDVAVFERRAGVPPRPAGVPPRPAGDRGPFDLVIVCDEGGPAGGLAPGLGSIGHVYRDTSVGLGLMSDVGEQTLWRDMLMYLGVPDFSSYRVGDAKLPDHYERDLMCRPARRPIIGALPAAICNAGLADGRRHELATWIPQEIVLEVTAGGAPLGDADVRWNRPPPGGEPPATPGPDGRGRTSVSGRLVIGGDVLAGPSPPPGAAVGTEPARWLRLEIEHAGRVHEEIIYALDLHAAWAAGDRERTTRYIAFPMPPATPTASAPD